jgi:HSP20 family protein
MSVSSVSGRGSFNENSSYFQGSPTEQQNLARIEAENTATLDALRDRFEHSYTTQQIAQDDALEQQKTKGYEQLRELRKSQQDDLRKLNKTAELEKNQLERSLKDSLHTLNRSSQTQLNDLRRERENLVELEKKSKNQDRELSESHHAKEIQTMQDAQEEQIAKITEENQATISQLAEKTKENIEKLETHSDSRLKEIIKNQDDSIQTVYTQAQQELNHLRRDTADKLTAYSTRQSDPFYRLVSLDAELRDDGDAYILTAQIPAYEQNHLSTSIKNNQLMIGGYRRNEETLKDDTGHSQSTSSFQSFSETFPLPEPVDSKNLTREHRENEVIIRVPKLNSSTFREPHHSHTDTTRVNPPKFPKNLGKRGET